MPKPVARSSFADPWNKVRCMTSKAQQQLLHIVIVGELVDFDRTTFKDVEKIETVGIIPDYAAAYLAWKAKAQQTVDNSHVRYFIVHLHRSLNPVEGRYRSAHKPGGAQDPASDYLMVAT